MLVYIDVLVYIDTPKPLMKQYIGGQYDRRNTILGELFYLSLDEASETLLVLVLVDLLINFISTPGVVFVSIDSIDTHFDTHFHLIKSPKIPPSTEPHTHYYMATLLRPDRLHNIAVLESPYFTSAKVAFLHFSVYSASASVDVKVCFDSARENRPMTAVNENIRHLGSFVRCRTVHQGYDKGSDGGLRRWNNYRMLLVPGFVKFYIMAEHTGLANDYAVVGIDRIYVTPCESN